MYLSPPIANDSFDSSKKRSSSPLYGEWVRGRAGGWVRWSCRWVSGVEQVLSAPKINGDYYDLKSFLFSPFILTSSAYTLQYLCVCILFIHNIMLFCGYLRSSASKSISCSLDRISFNPRLSRSRSAHVRTHIRVHQHQWLSQSVSDSVSELVSQSVSELVSGWVEGELVVGEWFTRTCDISQVLCDLECVALSWVGTVLVRC